MTLMKVVVSILFLWSIYFNVNIKCDLPVHCMVNEIEGEWILRINKETFDPALTDKKTTCGHGFPNRVDKSTGDFDYSFSSHYDINVSLDRLYNVNENGQKVGYWTPIYDQSFVIYYKNSIFTAPYKYFKSTNDKFISNCNKSEIGWLVPNKDNYEHGWSCFFAFKKGTDVSNFKRENNFLDTHTALAPTYDGASYSFAQVSMENKFSSKFKYDNFDKVVDEINSADLHWKAKIYDKFKGFSFLQVRDKLGMKKSMKNSKQIYEMGYSNPNFNYFRNMNNPHTNNLPGNLPQTSYQTVNQNRTGINLSDNYQLKKVRDKDSNLVTDYKEVAKYLNTPLDQIQEDTLPLNWDWRNVGGVSYVTEEIQVQGECGACYVFSTITSLESRLRIRTNNEDKTQFSKQFPLSYNFYSEGCDGGYPFLVGKFFHEFEIIPEDCLPYKQSDTDYNKLCDYKNTYKKKYKVSTYGYLGGFYGATSEAMMLKELRARGPFPGNILVPYTFNLYSHGIYSHSQLVRNSEKLSTTRMIDRKATWEKVEHSITIVGYGEENGVKFWVGKNTWGDNWGEDGYFRILRGENEVSIESMGDVLDIEFADR